MSRLRLTYREKGFATKYFKRHRATQAERFPDIAHRPHDPMLAFLSHLLICLALFSALPTQATENDPPGRVGRISLAGEGTLLHIGDSSASGNATLNWPLTTGARIETAGGARSEARIGSTALRIEGGASLEFLELSDDRIWLRLSRGSIAITVQNPEHAAEMALDTPQGRLRFNGPGSYRADAAGGTTAFSAYQGTATIEELGLAVHPGERILLLGGGDRNYLLGQAANDAFRQWALARELNEARPSNRHVSPEMTGQEALEQYGRWQETAEYGPAWFPQSMAAGWAPYRWGRWAWVPPWGWTWIDQAPWGFAPFHYGRWALIGGQWAWLPGTYVVRPVYAPALVVWLGQPGRYLSFSLGTAPAVGWYPLGPREVYYPHYRSSLHHVRSINASHVRQVSQIVTAVPEAGYERHHIHRQRHEAFTAAPQQSLQSGSSLERPASRPPMLPSVPAAAPPPVPKAHIDNQRPARQAQPWTETASAPKPDFRQQPVSPVPTGNPTAAPQVLVMPSAPAPPVRSIETHKLEPAPAMPTPRPQKAEAAYAPPPSSVVSQPAPQRQPRFEAGRAPAPHMEPRKHEPVMEKKREADHSEQARQKRGLPDR